MCPRGRAETPTVPLEEESGRGKACGATDFIYKQCETNDTQVATM